MAPTYLRLLPDSSQLPIQVRVDFLLAASEHVFGVT
jgi:hypothetical protein